MKIYRAMLQDEWENICERQYFGEEEMRQYGFIHCATAETILSILESYYKNTEDPIVLLCINTDLVIHQIKWEDPSYTGVDFPHIYCLLNLNAVDRVISVMVRNGHFVFSEELE